MKPALRLAIAILLFGMLLVSLIGCSGCRGRSDPSQEDMTSATAPAPLPDELPQTFTGEIAGGASFSIGLGGQRAWAATVQSVKITNDRQRQVLELNGLQCRLFQQGKVVLEVSADRGTFVRTGTLLRSELHGNIRATETKDHQRLQADAFRWVSSEDRVHVTKFTWTGRNATAHAERGIVSLDLSEVRTTTPTTLELLEPAPRR